MATHLVSPGITIGGKTRQHTGSSVLTSCQQRQIPATHWSVLAAIIELQLFFPFMIFMAVASHFKNSPLLA